MLQQVNVPPNTAEQQVQHLVHGELSAMFPRSPLPYYMRYHVLLTLCYLPILMPTNAKTYNQEAVVARIRQRNS